MATEAQPATQAKRVLVVEDEVMIRMMLEDMLGEPRDRPTLNKPFQMDGLKQMLQSALDRGRQ
jgi:hypothetical protein